MSAAVTSLTIGMRCLHYILSLNLCWRLGKEQLLSVRELSLLSLNKQCLLAIAYR
jgi:hypothetical protein